MNPCGDDDLAMEHDAALALALQEELCLGAELDQQYALEMAAMHDMLDEKAAQTGQPVADLDLTAVWADHTCNSFKCPILHDDVPKDEGVCIGLWNQQCCNHWVSKTALQQYISAKLNDVVHMAAVPCPICLADPMKCDKCAIYGKEVGSNGGSACCIPERQLRSLLSDDQLARVSMNEFLFYRNSNDACVVQCPHPECGYWCINEETEGSAAARDPGVPALPTQPEAEQRAAQASPAGHTAAGRPSGLMRRGVQCADDVRQVGPQLVGAADGQSTAANAGDEGGPARAGANQVGMVPAFAAAAAAGAAAVARRIPFWLSPRATPAQPQNAAHDPAAVPHTPRRQCRVTVPAGQGMFCPLCQTQYCLYCSQSIGVPVTEHRHCSCPQVIADRSGQGKAAALRRLEIERSEQATKGVLWQECPNCWYQAWKAEGECNVVTCKCKAKFCFLCGEDVTHTGHDHFRVPGAACYKRCFHKPELALRRGSRCTCGAPGCATQMNLVADPDRFRMPLRPRGDHHVG